MIAVEDLKEGAVVRLVSGSPKLTVTSVSRVTNASGVALGYAYCRVIWFSNRGELQEAEICSRFLTWPREHVPAEPSPPSDRVRSDLAAALDGPVARTPIAPGGA